jgi:hypothetical protein
MNQKINLLLIKGYIAYGEALDPTQRLIESGKLTTIPTCHRQRKRLGIAKKSRKVSRNNLTTNSSIYFSERVTEGSRGRVQKRLESAGRLNRR